MQRPISRPIHGWIDYLYVAAVATAPALLKFESTDKPAAAYCRILSASVLAATALTRAEWGFVRLIPFRVHLALDFTVSAFNVLAAPRLPGFSNNQRARSLIIALGIIGLTAVALTRPEELSPES